jgi:hypothetical protein
VRFQLPAEAENLERGSEAYAGVSKREAEKLRPVVGRYGISLSAERTNEMRTLIFAVVTLLALLAYHSKPSWKGR